MKKTFFASALSLAIFFALGAFLLTSQTADGAVIRPGDQIHNTSSNVPPTSGSNVPPTSGSNVPPTDGSNVPPIDGSNPGSGSGGPLINNPFNCRGVTPCTLYEFIKSVINLIIMPIGGVLAVLAFIFSGFLYVTAQGNETKIATAHRALLYTAIGTAVLLGAWTIANVIGNTVDKLK